jgi:hypothetical protein
LPDKDLIADGNYFCEHSIVDWVIG